MQEVKVEQCVRITGGALRESHFWAVQSSEIIDGVQFIHIQKRDSGFCRFVMGPRESLRDFLWFDEFRKLRKHCHV